MTSTTNRHSAAAHRGTKRNSVREAASHAAAGTKPEEREYVQGELALEADFDLRVLTSWRARHILSLGNEPRASQGILRRVSTRHTSLIRRTGKKNQQTPARRWLRDF